MNRREGYTNWTRGEARTAQARSLNFESANPLAKFTRLPWGFILLIVAMAIVGSATLFSSTYNAAGPSGEDHLWSLQFSRFLGSFVIMLIIAMTPISWWARVSFLGFAVTVFLLLMTDLFGLTRGGAERWLQIGPITLQPSELAKLTTTMALARYYQMVLTPQSGRFVVHLGALALLLPPFYFVFHQPDLGTALAIAAAGLVIVFLAGISIRVIIGAIILGIAALPGVYYFGLQTYQRERVDTLLAQFSGGSTNSLGESYQIEQGLIAIGSGGIKGKGYLQGIQSQQDYVPEQHTDFILTVIAEEFGFLGTTALLLAFAFIIAWSLNAAYQSRSWYGRLAAAGATATITFYVVFNVGMVIGLLPVVGMPLPLVSFGGTAMLTTMCCFGIILSAHMHKDEKVSPRGLF
jgi:rod shape determining protein RodA